MNFIHREVIIEKFDSKEVGWVLEGITTMGILMLKG